MITRFFTSLLLAIALSLSSISVNASHESNEKYDGTIKSFRWLKTPIKVSKVLIRNDSGTRFPLSQFKGKIVLLNLWASWCEPCAKELPALDHLQEKFGGNDFIIVAVSLDEDREVARNMFTELSIGSMKLFSQSAEELGKSFPVDVLPTTILINRDSLAIGLLRSSLNWTDDESVNLIKRLMGGVTADTLRSENVP